MNRAPVFKYIFIGLCTVLSFLGVTFAQAQNLHVPQDSTENQNEPDSDIEETDTIADADLEEGDLDAGEIADGDAENNDSDEEFSGADSDEPTDADEGLPTDVPEELDLPEDEMWIFVDKSERRMVVNDGQGYREAFRVALGQTPRGDKRREGDGRTPEGEYFVCRRITNNRFQHFLGISYPGPDDARRRRRHIQPIEFRAILRAHRRRVQPPWQTPLGGNIGIHGYGHRRDRERLHAQGDDWTDGCIAVTNEEIERIYQHTRLGTRVVIVP